MHNYALMECRWAARNGRTEIVRLLPGSRPNGVDSRRWPLGPGGAGLVWFGRFTPEKAPHLAGVEPALRAQRPLVLAGTLSDSVYFAERIAPRLSDEVRYAGVPGSKRAGPADRRIGDRAGHADMDARTVW